MKERAWTEAQRASIDARGMTLIVSAAAGSGKTATLTERVIRQITDAAEPVELSSLLIVTFMKAAAKEVRDRIGSALRLAAAEHPEDERLTRQLLTLSSAKIQTIDSFCASFLRGAGEAVGIAPNYRVMETAEAALLENNVMEDLLALIYDGALPEVASPEQLDALADSLVSPKRDADLAAVLLSVYGKTSGQVAGVRSIRALLAEYDPAAGIGRGETQCGRFIYEETEQFVSYAIGEAGRWARALADEAESNSSSKKLLDFAEQLKECFLRLADCGDFEALDRQIVAPFELLASKPRLTKKTAANEAVSEEIKELRKAFTQNFYDRYFLWSAEEWRAHASAMFALGNTLASVLEAFDARYLSEKKRLCALTFSDVEHLTCECLYGPDGEPTAFARSIRDGLHAVYIDEYQDVNELQDRIFAAISRPDNRFMVGDLKQCIYWFRGSEPDIFARMKSAYPPIGEAREQGGETASVFMSKNFRSDPPILAFVNSIFAKLFPLASPMLGYTEEDALIPGKSGAAGGRLPEIHLFDGEQAEGDEPADRRSAEAEAIAAQISSLLAGERKNDGTPIEPADIAILIRSSAMELPLLRAMQARGIPCESRAEADFFLNAEVLLALALLNSIDNPHRDIYLAGLLCSPLFAFSGEELVLLRQRGSASLYADLQSYADAGEDPALRDRLRSFLGEIDRCRRIADDTRADLFLSRLFRETGLYALAAKEKKKDNLLLLVHYARSFEENGGGGLSGYIAYLNRLIRDKRKIEEKKNDLSEANAVRIMTVHKSKGLEYPVCFLADCGREIRDLDTQQRCLFDPAFGISLRERAPGGFTLLDSAAHNAVADHHRAKCYEEEARVLYVALTRPRERLYLYGTVPRRQKDGSAAAFVRSEREANRNLGAYRAKHLHNFLSMALLADPTTCRIVYETEAARPKDLPLMVGRAEEAPPLPEDGGEVYRLACARFDYVYPDPALTRVPQKLSVSVLSPGVLDGADGERPALTIEEQEAGGRSAADDGDPADQNAENENKYLRFTDIAPRFYREDPAEESAKSGIATHTFLQFFDAERLAANGAAAELSRLRESGYLSAEDAARVRMDEISLFERSALFVAMRRAKRLLREFRFHAELPAVLFTGDEARRALLQGKTLLIQGVMDCVLEEEDGGLRLIDYKTDRLPAKALRDPAIAAAILREKHALQLSYYALAIERIFGRRPRTVEVYSLPLGATVDIPVLFR